MKKYIVLFILLLISSSAGASTWTASSCKYEDVNTVIQADTTLTGDTVSIPSGDCSAADVWSSTVTIPNAKKLIIQGQGYANTIIGHGSATVFNLGTSGSRVTGIQFKRMPANLGTTSADGVVNTSGQGWRIDHCFFNNNDTTVNTIGHEYLAIGNTLSNSLVTGLIDNNVIYGRIGPRGHGFSTAGTEWAAASRLGSENAIYVEDNFFKRVDLSHANIIDTSRGVTYVARYNTVGNSTLGGHAQFMAHGITQDDQRGTKGWELYGNSMTNDATDWVYAIALMGGTGVIFGNTHNSGYRSGGVYMYNERLASCVPSRYTKFGCCGDPGTLSVDGTGTGGYLCRDQIGAGVDSNAWTNNAINPTSEPQSLPAYIWLNRYGSAKWTTYVQSSESAFITENRDYFKEATPFDGTAGVGYGTVEQMNAITTCTDGVGFWATTDDYTTLTDYIGASTELASHFSSFCSSCGTRAKAKVFSGTLYKCSSNSWVSYYTPSAYPHSLRTEESVAPAFASTSLNGNTLTISLTKDVVVNTNTGFDLVCSGAGDEALTFVSEDSGVFTYTIDRSIPQTETCTVAYTTGANYIEDSAGNDLDSFTAQSVSNQTPAEAPTKKLTITKTGSGCTITSSPSGISCGSTCEFDFTTATQVTLGGYLENGWASITYSGGCAGGTADLTNDVANCTVTCTPIYLLN